jgi:hypothetical protein
MATVDIYRQYIQELLTERSKLVWNPKIKAETIFDPERDHYQLVYVGWPTNAKRVYGVVLHVDIIDEKIWIQQDGTEEGLANQLVELGVPKEDIILGFNSPIMRQYTDFGVG